MKKYSKEELKKGKNYEKKEDMEKEEGDIGKKILKKVGKWRMGKEEEEIVDKRMRFKGIEGMRVVDD